MPLPTQWQFVEVSDGKSRKWLWRRLVINGEIAATSELFDDFGAAIHNAIGTGFRPKDERWVTISAGGVTYFDPVDGATPLARGSRESALVYTARPQTTAVRKRIAPKRESQRSRPGNPSRSTSGSPHGKPRGAK